MNIKINGKLETLGGIASIADLVAEKELAPEKIVVEHNYQIVSKDKWHEIDLKDNDNLEIVSFVGGG